MLSIIIGQKYWVSSTTLGNSYDPSNHCSARTVCRLNFQQEINSSMNAFTPMENKQ